MSPVSLSDGQLRAEIAAERRELAALLTALPETSWDAPTLCEGWRVREVVAHVTLPYRQSLRQVGLQVLRARGRFNVASDRLARQEAAALTPAQLVSSLEGNAENPWKPPGGGYLGGLTHDVVHGLDWTVPLGIDRSVPPERLRPVLANLDTPRSRRFLSVDLTEVELRATDTDWKMGTGEPLTGRTQDLLLVLLGRKLPPGRLSGAQADRFTRTPAATPGTLQT